MMKRLPTALCLLMLAACSTPLPPEMPPISYDGPVYHISASRIDVVDDFTPSPTLRTEYRPKPSLAEAMHNWINRRFVAQGQQNVMEVRITDATIAKKDLPKQASGIEGFFTKEQTEEYTGKLSVELKLYTPDRTLPMAHAEISAELSQTLREDATLEDRKALYRTLTVELLNEISKSVDTNVHAYFGKYLM